MNFEFLKDKKLDYIYKNCEQAEKQVNVFPDSSLVSARKAAEALAKLIYMRAYSEEMTRMTFDDVLRNQEVRNFVNISLKEKRWRIFISTNNMKISFLQSMGNKLKPYLSLRIATVITL